MKFIFVFFVSCTLSRNLCCTLLKNEEITNKQRLNIGTDEIVESPETSGLSDSTAEILEHTAAAYSIKCKCGKAGNAATPINIAGKSNSEVIEVEPLIINGSPAAQDEFPWMVGLSKKRLYDFNKSPPKIVCGGSLINNKYVLTAAHCINNEFTHRFELLVRAHNTSSVNDDPKVLKLKAKRFIPHPGWDAKTVSNDIGLIELATPLDFSAVGVVPVCLPSKYDGDFSNANATVIGWGYTRPKGAMANILQKVTVPVISHDSCTQTRYGDIVTATMLCAGYQEGGKDACTNDSGGPLTVVQNGAHKLIGIVSWGHGCAQPLFPGVYTRVTKYLDWINSVVSRVQSCNA